MQVFNQNDVKIYSLSQGKTLPEFISEKRRRALLKSDGELRRRIQLVQDFEMPTATQVLKVSPDNGFIMTAGTYKPRIRCYDTGNLSMKWERFTDSDVVDLEILSDDWQKLVLLFANRLLQFHNADGKYHELRIPKFGRSLKYNRSNCELYSCGDGNTIYRFSLEAGQFLEPFESDLSEGLNTISINPETGLIMTGSKNGVVECWDSRVRKSVAKYHAASDVVASFGDDIAEDHYTEENIDSLVGITALGTKGALTLGVGFSTGHVMLYDVRSSKPSLEKDLRYGLPVKSIKFVKGGAEAEDLVLSADSRCAKLWRQSDGAPVTAIECETKINDMTVFEGTGLVMMPVEQPKIQTYFVPHLGPAPKWCAFLDCLAEELEEETGGGVSGEMVYDNYKFVTPDELRQLGIDSLIGTKMLRAYMHGYFVDEKFYRNVKQTRFGEQSLEDKRVALINAQIAARRDKSRIDIEPTKYNKKLAKSRPDLKGDDRFGGVFERPELEIDSDDPDFQMRNAHNSLKRLRKLQKDSDEEGEKVRVKAIDSSDDEGSSDDGTWRKNIKAVHKLAFDKKAARKEALKLVDESTQLTSKISKISRGKLDRLNKLASLGEVKEVLDTENKLIGERVANQTENQGIQTAVTGNQEISFKVGRDINDEEIVLKKRPKKQKPQKKPESGSSRRSAMYMLPKDRKRR